MHKRSKYEQQSHKTTISVAYEKDEFLNHLWSVCLCGYTWIRLREVPPFCEVKGATPKESAKKKVSLRAARNPFREPYSQSFAGHASHNFFH